ncbi:MAG: hypothetical protein GY795_46670 [Desulfobacterales bacterium]|nr:hypothetical protein [Desulfobacterales bacterium]
MRGKKIISLILMVSTAIGLSFHPITVYADNVIIICNKSVAENSLTRQNIKNIFMGKKTRWNDDRKIIFVIMKGSEVHKTFLQKYVEKDAFLYNNYWKKQVFIGRGKPPKSFKTEESLIDYIAGTKGAIGYISSGADKDLGTVKVISVQ